MNEIHNDALFIESMVKKVHNCERGGMAGLIDADNFALNPFDAAIISLALFWKNIPMSVLENFIYKWSNIRDAESNKDIDLDGYKKELSDIIEKYYKS